MAPQLSALGWIHTPSPQHLNNRRRGAHSVTRYCLPIHPHKTGDFKSKSVCRSVGPPHHKICCCPPNQQHQHHQQQQQHQSPPNNEDDGARQQGGGQPGGPGDRRRLLPHPPRAPPLLAQAPVRCFMCVGGGGCWLGSFVGGEKSPRGGSIDRSMDGCRHAHLQSIERSSP